VDVKLVFSSWDKGFRIKGRGECRQFTVQSSYEARGDNRVDVKIFCTHAASMLRSRMVNCQTLSSTIYSHLKSGIGMTFHTGFEENINQGNDIRSYFPSWPSIYLFLRNPLRIFEKALRLSDSIQRHKTVTDCNYVRRLRNLVLGV